MTEPGYSGSATSFNRASVSQLEPVVDPVLTGGSVVLFGDRAACALALQPPPGTAPGAGGDAIAPGTEAFLPEVGAALRPIGASGSMGSISLVTPLGDE